MLGMEMMIKSLGINPEEVKATITGIVSDIAAYKVAQETMALEIKRQGVILDALAKAAGIVPTVPSTLLEIEHDGN